jgi:hypothetical protein
MSGNPRKIPLESAVFETIEKSDNLYGDKTWLIYNHLKAKKPRFQTRPVRSGETSAIEAVLRGYRDMFKGLGIKGKWLVGLNKGLGLKDLWIEGSDYEWETHPVIRLSLGEIDRARVTTLKNSPFSALIFIAQWEGLTVSNFSQCLAIKTPLYGLYLKRDKKIDVDILIDRDERVLRQIENPKLTKEINDTLHPFYNALKNPPLKLDFLIVSESIKIGQSSFIYARAFNILNNLTLRFEFDSGIALNEFVAPFSERIELATNELKTRFVLPPKAQIEDLREKTLEWRGASSRNEERQTLNQKSIPSFNRNVTIEGNFAKTSGYKIFPVNSVNAEKIGDNSFNAEESPYPSPYDVNLEIGLKLNITPLPPGYFNLARREKREAKNVYLLDSRDLNGGAGRESHIPFMFTLKTNSSKERLKSVKDSSESGFNAPIAHDRAFFSEKSEELFDG